MAKYVISFNFWEASTTPKPPADTSNYFQVAEFPSDEEAESFLRLKMAAYNSVGCSTADGRAELVPY